MRTSDQVVQPELSERFNPSRIRTTLYDLVEALGEEVESGEEHLIARTVFHMIRTGQMRFVRTPKGL
jgi:hypothetical protein